MSRVFSPTTVTILPTNVCNAACRHCSMNAGPDREDTMTWETLEMVLDQLFLECNLNVIVFSGGESTLLGETLLKALRKCRDQRILTRLVTNAFWAKSMDEARVKLKSLRDAGLNELNISTDDYHLPFISLQRVHNAFNAALELDFGSVVICNAYGPESWLTPERLNEEFGGGGDLKLRFGADGESLYHEREQNKTMVMLSNGLSQQLGRGVEGLEESEVVHHTEETLYEMADKLGGCPWAIRSAAVSAKGHFVSCCGLEVEDNPILDYGDMKEHPLSELLDRADNDVISNMIAIFGPPKIKQILEQIAPDEINFPRKSYRAYCEVCEDLVGLKENREAMYNHMETFMESILQVREVYRERFAGPDGEVRIPMGTNLAMVFRTQAEEMPEGYIPLENDVPLAELVSMMPVKPA